MIERAQRAGCQRAIVLTVDNHVGRATTSAGAIDASVDPRVCTALPCQQLARLSCAERRSTQGIDVSRVKESTQPSALTRNFLDRLRGLVTAAMLLRQGHQCAASTAASCCAHGADGPVVVSNHGGRDEESLRSTIECLPRGGRRPCRGRVPVLARWWASGAATDVIQGASFGASAVGIGRPQIWGLAPYGQAGVEAILDIYARELRAIMRQAGTPSVASITRDFVVARAQAPR